MFFNPKFSAKEEIVKYFDKRCRDYGFRGIFIINGAINTKDLKKLDSDVDEIWYLKEPSTSISIFYDSLKSIPYSIVNRVMKKISSKHLFKYNGDKLLKDRTGYTIHYPYIPGVFFGWDNTSRHGSRGDVVTSPSKDTFMKYMDSIKDSEYVFINAWNEWCEGMILEPTEENGYKYLEWIKEWIEEND